MKTISSICVCRPMPRKILSFRVFRIMFRFHFKAQCTSPFHYFLGSISISWLGEHKAAKAARAAERALLTNCPLPSQA